MILAEITSPDGRTVGSEYFFGFTSSKLEARFHFWRAHKWADARIKLCEKQETK